MMDDAHSPSSGNPPAAFPLLFALVCFHGLIAFAYFKAANTLLFVGAILASVSIVYFFWRRQNWARVVIILTAVTDFILDLPRFGHSPPLMQIVLSLRLIAATALLIWLNTPAIRAYFQRNI
jgi:uncharacterized membrane protein